MTEPLKRSLDAQIDEARIHEVWRNVEPRLRPRPSMSGLRVALVMGSLAAAVALGIAMHDEHPPTLALDDGAAPSVLETESSHRTLVFDDGSVIAADPATTLLPTLNDGERFHLRMPRGGATFSVTPGGPRRWVIDAGPAIVEVVGTVFRIEHASDGAVVVSVERGRVQVSAPATGTRMLGAGERLRVEGPAEDAIDGSAAMGRDAIAPVIDGATDIIEEPEDAEPPMPSTSTNDPGRIAVARETPPVEAPEPVPVTPEPIEDPRDWATLAAVGDFGAAYDALGPEGLARSMEGASPETLMRLGDVARLSGHPRDAIGPLQRLLDLHGGDARAPLAAIMLGRIQQDALRDPRAAIDALERAAALGPPRALALDVESRLALALLDAGDGRGVAAARSYVSAHPTGPRAALLRARLRASRRVGEREDEAASEAHEGSEAGEGAVP